MHSSLTTTDTPFATPVLYAADGAPRSQGTTCKLLALDVLMTHAGDVIPTAIYIAQNVTAPGPAVAPSASEDAT